MIVNSLKPVIAVIASGVFLVGCGATSLVSTPLANIDTVPLKISELTDSEKKSWGHKDLIKDTIPGMSVDKAYSELIGTKRGETVIVAVLDSGMDLTHEDLDGVLWTNSKEKPGNGKDDDNNGYVDDIHGYNFLGESYNEQLEFARMLRLNVGEASQRAKAQVELDKEYSKALQNKQQYEQIKQVVTYFSEQVNYNLNKDFDGRGAVGDDAYNFDSKGYGNGNPKNRVDDESHGTHVAGIIAAERNNGKGVNGVAKNVKLMSIRAVPNGDEYDKDIALGIRYAVDNGAKIINCSFGKSYSPNAEWVYDAIKYAAAKDVLIVHAAGNDGNDLDDSANPNFPNDHKYLGSEITDNVIVVGALDPSYGSKMVASFSNYGNRNVDVFAPGGQVYSTMPNNNYDFQGGTSMAAPAVAGVAALIRSYYPKLSASQVKNVLMQSGLKSKASVILAGDTNNSKSFSEVSKSGKMVNAYNALILAGNIAKGKQTLDANAE